jgi:hypothetical protein
MSLNKIVSRNIYEPQILFLQTSFEYYLTISNINIKFVEVSNIQGVMEIHIINLITNRAL